MTQIMHEQELNYKQFQQIKCNLLEHPIAFTASSQSLPLLRISCEIIYYPFPFLLLRARDFPPSKSICVSWSNLFKSVLLQKKLEKLFCFHLYEILTIFNEFYNIIHKNCLNHYHQSSEQFFLTPAHPIIPNFPLFGPTVRTSC